MQTLDELDVLDDQMETIHLYVVREQPKKPYTALPLFGAFLCLLGIVALTLYSAEHPYYEHKRLTVPAELLPLRVFTAQASVVPTGVKIYPAIAAHGILTITNGSIIGQAIPAGFTVKNIATDSAVYVPPGNANGYGYATVAAHALTSGKGGNIAAYMINQVEGSSVYIRNLSAFSGGKDGYSVSYATVQDKQTAVVAARNLLVASTNNGFHYPCTESYLSGAMQITTTWRCQFVMYHVPSYMHVVSAELAGDKFLVDVTFIARPLLVHSRFGIGH